MLQRISYSQEEVGLMNDIIMYMENIAAAVTIDNNIVARHVGESVTAKTAKLRQVLSLGVLEE